jgi:hypothetical protein
MIINMLVDFSHEKTNLKRKTYKLGGDIGGMKSWSSVARVTRIAATKTTPQMAIRPAR